MVVMCFSYCGESVDIKFLIVVTVAMSYQRLKITRSVTQKLIWNKICGKRRSLSLYRDGYWVNHRCLSCEVSMLIGCQLNSGMIIMQGMGSQVFHIFGVATAHRRCWIVVTYAGSPLGSMDQLKINSCSKFQCYRKMNLILLFSESCRLL